MARFKVFLKGKYLATMEGKDKADIAQEMCKVLDVDIYEENEEEESKQGELFPRGKV